MNLTTPPSVLGHLPCQGTFVGRGSSRKCAQVLVAIAENGLTASHVWAVGGWVWTSRTRDRQGVARVGARTRKGLGMRSCQRLVDALAVAAIDPAMHANVIAKRRVVLKMDRKSGHSRDTKKFESLDHTSLPQCCFLLSCRSFSGSAAHRDPDLLHATYPVPDATGCQTITHCKTAIIQRITNIVSISGTSNGSSCRGRGGDVRIGNEQWFGQSGRTPGVADTVSKPADDTPSQRDLKCWCRQRDSNPRPTVYKTAALPLSYAGAAGLCRCGAV